MLRSNLIFLKKCRLIIYNLKKKFLKIHKFLLYFKLFVGLLIKAIRENNNYFSLKHCYCLKKFNFKRYVSLILAQDECLEYALHMRVIY